MPCAGWPRPGRCRPCCASPTRPRPRCRLATPDELAEDDEGEGGCLAIVGFEGSAEDLSPRVAGVKWALERTGAERDRIAGAQWAEGRFRGPYLRDALLDAGALVETLETVAFWSRLPALYAAVSQALRGCSDRGRHPAGGPVPHLPPLPRPAPRSISPSPVPRPRTRSLSGGQPSGRPATPSWPRAGRSPTTTESAPTTARGTSARPGRSGCGRFGRSRPSSIRRGSSTPAC